MLKEKLQEIMAASASKLSAPAKSVVMSSTQAVSDSIGGRAIPATGDALPEFTLSDSTGKSHSSKDLVDQKQLILTFFRGSW
jgi:hypothetical protein